MSDYEDEMDVDAPSKDVQFSSENASGKKRTAADLPVEAEDNLPWWEPVDPTVSLFFILTVTTCPGSKNTVQIVWMMSPATKIY